MNCPIPEGIFVIKSLCNEGAKIRRNAVRFQDSVMTFFYGKAQDYSQARNYMLDCHPEHQARDDILFMSK